MPELVVSLQSAFSGQSEVALGNALGSNVFNILFILGISAMITPLVVAQQLVRFDVPLMIGLSVLLSALAADGRLGRWDGLILTLGLVTYTTWAILQSRKEQSAIQNEYAAEFGVDAVRPTTAKRLAGQIALFVLGLATLVMGARVFTGAAVDIARGLGVSELIIGLTIVAAGTSLPEVATSVMAAVRGERDLAVGNAVGSNLFNIMAVLGITALTAPLGIDVPEAAMRVDIPVTIAVSVACLPIFFTGSVIARWEGALFLAYFVAYMTYLFLSATESSIERTFSVAMVGFVIPLTAITLAIAVKRSLATTPTRPDR